ncbi:hypothetical protein [Leptolyngbya sp. PCC 6406]|uniref:hypothetical protein n=1 Tax=Leptolyngbya sp. PCC 6406 TaxID=1173264 RepID=UPI0002ABDD55|nr:hypothetical protein [Leptolyngbya sp. PCC 6406]
MLPTKQSLSLNDLKGMTLENVSDLVAEWFDYTSLPSITTIIDSEALARIKDYEVRYQMTSRKMKAQVEEQGFVDGDVTHWLTLVELYPECLCMDFLDTQSIA